jgi:hypothetical protein
MNRFPRRPLRPLRKGASFSDYGDYRGPQKARFWLFGVGLRAIPAITAIPFQGVLAHAGRRTFSPITAITAITGRPQKARFWLFGVGLRAIPGDDGDPSPVKGPTPMSC